MRNYLTTIESANSFLTTRATDNCCKHNRSIYPLAVE